MKLIETKTLVSAAASIEFTSIPQTFTDLVVLFSLRETTNAGFLSIEINTLTVGFTSRQLVGFGTGVVSQSRTDNVIPLVVNESPTTANTFSNGSMYFPNYAGSTNKSISLDTVTENNATSASNDTIHAMLWSNTAAISNLKFVAGGTSFVVGSTISLYGIKKGSDGIVTTS